MPSSDSKFPAQWGVVGSVGVLLVAVILAYANSFAVPMLLDDDRAIADNPSIRDLRDWAQILWPAPSATTGGRPLLNFSFAVNYAIGGLDVRTYHLTNLTIHIVAGLTLLGLMRRTLVRPGIDPRISLRATSIAVVAALIWLLHPLQTSAVSYISQRAESLMGLFYLTTLYAFCRSLSSDSPWRWQTVSVIACLAGMATKEVMVSAPLMVLLYDRAFGADSFLAALVRRRNYYFALASSWLLLATLMVASQVAQRDIGFEHGVGVWEYMCTQAMVIAGYVWLAGSPYPVVFDYGPEILVRGLRETWLPALCILATLGASLAWFRKSPRAAFPALAFFILLAPTSSIVPIALQPMAESRMYLPLAALTAGGVFLAWRILPRSALLFCGLLAIGFGILTYSRNALLADPPTLWQRTLLAVPNNSRAHDHAAIAYDRAGKPDRAEFHFREAIRLNPQAVVARTNYAVLLAKLGRYDEAIRYNTEAIQLRPAYAGGHRNLAHLLLQNPQRAAEAVAHFQEAVRLDPLNFEGHAGLVQALVKLNRFDEARSHCESTLATTPALAGLRRSLADACAVNARPDDAIALYQDIIARDQGDAEVFYNLGVLLHQRGRLDEALVHYEQALLRNPRHFGALNNKGLIWGKAGRLADAIRCFEAALAINPTFQSARENLDLYRAKSAAQPPMSR